jgi:hypothetical protein
MKYHTLTLPDTKGAMIANVTMIKKKNILTKHRDGYA